MASVKTIATDLPGSIVVLGEGRLGRSLHAAIGAAGLSVHGAPARRPLPAELLAEAALVLLAVPDAAIHEVAGALATCRPRRDTGFVHLSGALGLDVLAPLSARGCPVGSFHPFQPFASERPPSAFRGATIGVEASDTRLDAQLHTLATALGAQARRVPAADRVLYHVAAVMASTYVVTLAAQAQLLLQRLGWNGEESLAALLPLIGGTLENLAANGVPEALSGPLRRGDAETIARHLAALDALPDAQVVARVYRVLGIAACELAINTGLEQATAERIARSLTAETTEPQASGATR